MQKAQKVNGAGKGTNLMWNVMDQRHSPQLCTCLQNLEKCVNQSGTVRLRSIVAQGNELCCSTTNRTPTVVTESDKTKYTPQRDVIDVYCVKNPLWI